MLFEKVFPFTSEHETFHLRKFLIAAVGANTIFVTNNCNETIWIGITADPGKDLPDNGGFALDPIARRPLSVTSDWAGRIWGRTKCSENGTCETGDCGKSGVLTKESKGRRLPT